MNKGFTLVELVAIIFIMGVMFVGAVQLINPIMQRAKFEGTRASMDRIVVALAGYAHRNSRIPCPADPNQTVTTQPYGAEFGSGADGTDIGDCDNTNAEGVVPFLTLGLKERDARDGWGNILTYRVSPAFTQDPAAGNVHARCRRETIWFSSGGALIVGNGGPTDFTLNNAGNQDIGGAGGGVSGAPLNNRNGSKARFCCPAGEFADDLVITDGSGDLVWPFIRDNTAANYGAVSAVVPLTDPALTANVTALAMVLVSHGENGIGAFLPDGTQFAGAGSPDETENRDGDNTFVSRDYSEGPGNNAFDDILVWRTQDKLYADSGNGTCGIP